MRGGDLRRISRAATGRNGHLTPIAIEYLTLPHSRGERNGSPRHTSPIHAKAHLSLVHTEVRSDEQ
eukprot:3160355-Prymnesium_polylepis.1